MRRAFYSNSLARFKEDSVDTILGRLAQGSSLSLGATQRDAWLGQIDILKDVLGSHSAGTIYFEFAIPRLGKRIDAVLLIGPVLFVMEFKVGEDAFTAHALDQTVDYAMDLKHFHQSSHNIHIV